MAGSNQSNTRTVENSKLCELIDKMEIEEKIKLWCRGVDRADIEATQCAYHPDSTDQHGSVLGNGIEISEMLTNFSQTVDYMTHQVSNILIELHGDVALAESYFLATTSSKSTDEGVAVIGGRYLDRFERREGDWRIAERTTMFDWHFHVSGAFALDKERADSFVPRGSKRPDDELYALLANKRVR